MYSIEGVVQHYSWGGYDFIPRLLGKENVDGRPWAEYWLGAHPNHPAVITATGQRLDDLLQGAGEKLLGINVYNRFQSLPFLLKILDVRQMLSIQVHPDKEGAAEGYARDEAAGIPITAPHRNYRDRNHKPEMMVALGDFWLLHGFKPEGALEAILQQYRELQFLLPLYKKEGYRGLFEAIMQMPVAEVEAHLAPLLHRILPLYKGDKLSKDGEDFWAARAATTYGADRGIFCIYIFNLVRLREGQAIYQGAGLPHAYLEGQNIEIMANSDNVLRAGLTEKHIAVEELLRHVIFEATHPQILEPADGYYPAPAEEFELYVYNMQPGSVFQLKAASGEILLVIDGSIMLNGKAIDRGAAVFIPAGTAVEARTAGSGRLCRAAVRGR